MGPSPGPGEFDPADASRPPAAYRRADGSPGSPMAFFSALTFRVGPLACLAAAALAAVVWGPAWSAGAAPLPWIVSLAFVGLPHGAADFALSRRTWRGRPLAGLWLAYLAIMAAVAAAFVTAPVPVIVAFAALSVWHFGLAHTDGEQPERQTWGGRIPAALLRGCVVLAAPLAVWPAETAAVAAELMTLVPGPGRVFDPAAVRSAGFGLGTVAAAAAVLEGWLAWRRPADRRRWLAGLLDSGVILALGCVADPLFAVGLYFLVWHGWRQMQPLVTAVEGDSPADWRTLAAGLTRIHAAALPLLVPTWLAIGGAWWAWSPGHTARDLAILSIGAYLVVTPAHELLGDLLRVITRHRTAAPRRPAPRIDRRCPTTRSLPA